MISEVTSSVNQTMEGVWSWLFGSLSLSKLIAAIVILLICLLASRMLLSMVRKGTAKSRLDVTLQRFLLQLLKVFLVALSVMISAQTLGINVTSLVAVLGVSSLAISLALQGTLSNLVGGVMLLTARPFTQGDFIECGSYSGTVQAIGLFYTTIRTYDNRNIFLPNSTLSGSTIVNYSTEPKRLVEIKVSASYDSPVDTVKTALRAAIVGAPGLLEEEPVLTVVDAYNASDIGYLLRCWVKSESYFAAKYAIMEQIKTEFDHRGVVFTYPHVTVHMGS